MNATRSQTLGEMPGVLDCAYGQTTGDSRLPKFHFRYRGRLIAAA